jgi:hypothetical protein
MGCQGQAPPRGAKPWSQKVVATWALGEGTVVMADPGYRVELTFSSKRTGYETSGGNGAMRVFSGTAGDSISIPVRVDEGC